MRTTGLIVCVALAAWSAQARAVVIDFEDIDMGFDRPLVVGPSIEFLNVGKSGVNVTIVGGQPRLKIDDLTSYPGTSGQALLDSEESGAVPHVTTILFDRAVANFQLSAGDLGGGDEADTPLEITAYEVGDTALGSDSATWGPVQTPPFATLTVAATGIRKVLYSSGGILPNSTYIDNLTFTPVPEPSACALLGWVIVGCGAVGRRRLAPVRDSAGRTHAAGRQFSL